MRFVQNHQNKNLCFFSLFLRPLFGLQSPSLSGLFIDLAVLLSYNIHNCLDQRMGGICIAPWQI